MYAPKIQPGEQHSGGSRIEGAYYLINVLQQNSLHFIVEDYSCHGQINDQCSYNLNWDSLTCLYLRSHLRLLNVRLPIVCSSHN